METNQQELNLKSTDITSEVCNKCIKSGPPHCCEISLGQREASEMYMDLIECAIEGLGGNLRITPLGEVLLTCTHLDKENGVCTIYETRPQMCRSYNCVSFAQVDYCRGAPKQYMEIYNKVEWMLTNQEQTVEREI